jgi:hypothetical protein
MARLVVRNKDKWHNGLKKRGMVVDVLPDGKSLGAKGESYPEWTVVDVPGAPVEEFMDFLESGNGRRRRFLFDLDAYAGGELTFELARSLKRGV